MQADRLKDQRTPRAAYVHVPFCRHRCGYCNFTLVAGRDDLIAAYLTAIQRELSTIEARQVVDSLFLGGGTPSHLSERELDQLLTTVRTSFTLAPHGEFSIEANPVDITRSKARLLAAHGVTRMSLGIQSFHGPKLQILERDHDQQQIHSAVGHARDAGIHVALDLIFGVPLETLAVWADDLTLAIALQPQHISTYGLTWEKGTSFWSRKRRADLSPIDEELEAQMYELAIERLVSSGFEHYEVSNFAQSGHRCRHNETYWTGRPYYAAGPGAARYVGGRREVNHRSVTTYLRRVLAGKSPVHESESLDPEDIARERLVFGLRRLEGVNRWDFRCETGYEIEELGEESLKRFVANHYLEWRNDQLRLTRTGLMVSDSLWPAFLRR